MNAITSAIDGLSAVLGTKPTLKQQVINDIGYKIVSGELPSGTVLQQEQLASDRDVALTVVREAVSVLASLGLVESRKRKGTIVLPYSQWNHVNPQIIAWKLHDPTQRRNQFLWLIQLRSALEPAAAALAAQSRSDKAADLLQQLGKRLKKTAQESDLDGFLEADVLFHEVIFTQCGNPIIAHMAQQMDVVLSARHYYDYMPQQPDFGAVAFHIMLADAIAERDSEKARNASALIVDQSTDEFLSIADSHNGLR